MKKVVFLDTLGDSSYIISNTCDYYIKYILIKMSKIRVNTCKKLIIFKQKMPSRDIKCNRCKCKRKKRDFKRRNKTFKTCNMCADLDKKYQQKKKSYDDEPVITLVDLWPDYKDSTNSEAVKNDPKIDYTILWDNLKGLEEVECKYDKIPSSFKFRIPDSDTLNNMLYD